MCTDFGKVEILLARTIGNARILCFLRRLLHWLHCCGVYACWRFNGRQMPPKGAKAALSAGRVKPLRTSATTRQGAAIEVTRGSGEKTSAKSKNT
ncbi:hypothetical protein NDU88_006733 [Pleurodeles waltl]|uniref:Uncharacterized protein n=1 Tax=Pleurodeles waltl TaxID=8319 RepID=A0AAV7NR67_PLEWA|nr:hypothetical protein NDU88_006733 [Pleurodeles waltl]